MKPVILEWNFNGGVILIALLLTICFYRLTRFKLAANNTIFITAIALFLLVTCSPLHFLGMHYYFSAHMVSHVILLLICGPMLVLSIPSAQKNILPNFLTALAIFFKNNTWVAWLTGVGIMWLWHVPVIFDWGFAPMNAGFSFLPALHSGSMLLAGAIFSWPLFGPEKRFHIHPLSGVIYLFTACVSCSLLGLLITFAPLTTYQHYLTENAGPLNISRSADQQAAGLIMWVPCCFVYLSGCISLLSRWFREGATAGDAETIILNTNLTHE